MAGPGELVRHRSVAGELVAEVDSFEVMRGEGGVKGLSSLKALVRANALKTLNASRFPIFALPRKPLPRPGMGTA